MNLNFFDTEHLLVFLLTLILIKDGTTGTRATFLFSKSCFFLELNCTWRFLNLSGVFLEQIREEYCLADICKLHEEVSQQVIVRFLICFVGCSESGFDSRIVLLNLSLQVRLSLLKIICKTLQRRLISPTWKHHACWSRRKHGRSTSLCLAEQTANRGPPL